VRTFMPFVAGAAFMRRSFSVVQPGGRGGLGGLAWVRASCSVTCRWSRTTSRWSPSASLPCRSSGGHRGSASSPKVEGSGSLFSRPARLRTLITLFPQVPRAPDRWRCFRRSLPE
jgi:hypothetical protein